MKEYLHGIIIEMINRGLCLKELIPHPLEYAELDSLADRCKRIIDDNIEYLKYFQKELDNRPENETRDILRGIKSCIREIDLVESFGISALYYETPEVGYLNKLIRKIHQEINLPLTPPSVACFSTSYYSFQSFTNVMLVPIGESKFLLQLPDSFHEIGHEVLSHMSNERKLKGVENVHQNAVTFITDYYRNLRSMKEREYGPESRLFVINHIHSQWKIHWLKEFFCDLFALYTLGPAYAWSNMFLTTKKFENVYEFSDILPQTHPSDDSRMRMLIIGLKKLGFNEEAELLENQWNSMSFVVDTQPVNEYQYAYPADLLAEIAELFLCGLKECNFSIITPENIKNLDPNSIVGILNRAWQIFTDNPEEFLKWEEEIVNQLKQEFLD